MTLEELRIQHQEATQAKVQALKDSLGSMVGQRLQKVECWADEGLIILTFDNASLSVEADSELRIEHILN